MTFPAPSGTVPRFDSYQGPECPFCRVALPREGTIEGIQNCRACGQEFEAAFFTPPESGPERTGRSFMALDQAAPCARHEANEAVAACDRCGQFMCGLCRIPTGKSTYCPDCYERLTREGKHDSVATRFLNHGALAMLCLLGSMGCFVYLASLILGPAGIYFCVKGIRGRNERGEPQGVVTLYLALVLHILLTIGGLAYIGMFVFMIAGGFEG